jgi:outer membrane protein
MRAFVIAGLLCPGLAFAQAGNEVSATVGLGVQSAPAYFGADRNEIGPTGSFALESLQFGDITMGGASEGFGFGGSLRYIGPRKASDHAELAGLRDIDAALEIGGGLRYTTPDFAAFANLRYGLGGHESLVADLGADFITPLAPSWELRAGPRILWGSQDYTRTYFGVTEDEAADSAFTAYAPGAGLVSAGLAAEVTYQFNADWGVSGTIRYDALQGDAADSPIVQSDDQITAGLILTRTVRFGF